MLVISIVPRLPPAIDGLGDYALQLAHQLRKDFGIETHFIVGDPSWSGATSIDGFSIHKLEQRSASALLSSLNDYQTSSVILLHYVGHGYAIKGCPFWLVAGLEQWKNKIINAKLVTMFHEVHPYGDPPWRINFWLSPLQKDLAIRLAKVSDSCLTSTEEYAKILYNLSRAKQAQIPTIPVFSNIGEPEKVSDLSERHQRLVVFGQKKSRLRVYQESLAELNQACQAVGIKEIWDIGPATGLNLAEISSVPVVELGEQPALEISEIMLNSVAGFFNYDTNRLAKSGIFAAYCSHGLLPISHQCVPCLDSIKAGKNYWFPDKKFIRLLALEESQAIADNAYTWYQNHRLSVQAKTFVTYLGENLQDSITINNS